LGVLALAVAVQLIVVYAPTAPGGPEISGLDKLIHLVVFAAPTLAALLAGLPRPWVLAVFLLHAPLSELVQARLLADRDGSLLDAVADVTGVLLGAAAFVAMRRPRRW